VYAAGDSQPNFLGSENFLGSADVDLQDLRSNVKQAKVLELLGGTSVSGARGKRRRGRLRVEYTIFKKIEEVPPPLEEKLARSMEILEKVAELDCRIRKAKNLPKSGLGCRLQCVVRVVQAAGIEQDLHSSKVVALEKQEVSWDDDRFQAVFRQCDDPVFLVFDVYAAAKGDPRASGCLLGSAFVPLATISISRNKHKLSLYGQSTGGESGDRLQSTNSHCCLACSKRSSQLGKEVCGVLSVDLGARRCEEKMPHVELLHESFVIANEEDVDLALEDDAWQKSSFGMPQQLIAMQDRSVRFRPALVSGVNSIVFICGIIHGATGLRNDAKGRKSDPYCVVEAASSTGVKVLVHRTRCIRNRLCPRWNEAFYSIVPAQMEVDRLILTIMDCEMGEGFRGPDGPDEVLGFHEVDLSLLLSSEGLVEERQLEAPLVKLSRSHNGFFRSSSFSSIMRGRDATVSYEVRIERRVKPVFQDRTLSEEDARVPTRHSVTQTLCGTQAFVDPSQRELEASSHLAAKIHQLHGSGKLQISVPKGQHASTRGKWLCPRGIDEQRVGMTFAKGVGGQLKPLLTSTKRGTLDAEDNPWLRRTNSAPAFNPAEDNKWNATCYFRPRLGSENRLQGFGPHGWNAIGRAPWFLSEAGKSADASLCELHQKMPPAWLGLGAEQS